MRVTNAMTSRTLIANIQDDYERLSLYQRQLASGKRINFPSDDPLAMYRAFNLSDSITRTEQYKSNIDMGLDELNMLSNVMNNVQDRVLRLKQIVVEASNDLVTQGVLNTYAEQVNEILSEFVGFGNSVINEKYMFAGYKTTTKPFTDQDLTGPGGLGPPDGLTDTVSYTGDTGERSVEISPARTTTVNIVGDNTLDPTKDALFVNTNLPTTSTGMFNFLIKLRDDLNAGNTAAIRGVDQADLSVLKDYVDGLIGKNAVQVQEIMSLRDTHDSDELFKKGILANVQEADLVETASGLSNAQVAYQAALTIGSRINQTNLFDFLR